MLNQINKFYYLLDWVAGSGTRQFIICMYSNIVYMDGNEYVIKEGGGGLFGCGLPPANHTPTQSVSLGGTLLALVQQKWSVITLLIW